MKPIHWMALDDVPGLPGHYRRFHVGDSAGDPRVLGARPTLADLDARAGATNPDPPETDLASAVTSRMSRLGASERSLATARGLAQGNTWLVFTGQQPSIVGGPLYTLHKAATAVAVARKLRALGRSVAPAFWIASDDADLQECGTGYAPGPDRAIVRATLDRTYARGVMAGDLPVAEVESAIRRLLGDLPPKTRALLAETSERAEDCGSWLGALILRLFGDDGVVVVDSRMPELRRAAAPIIGRYLELHSEVAERVNDSGQRLESIGIERPVHPASAESALFVVRDGIREKIDPAAADARRLPADNLSPGVVLRPYVQDGLFPVLSTVVGPGELSYLAQTAAIGELLGVERGPSIPRLSASWVDRTTAALASGDPDKWRMMMKEPGTLVAAHFRSMLPEELAHALGNADREIHSRFEELEAAAKKVDSSLSEQVASAARKVRFQLGRLEERALTRAKSQAAKRGEVLTNLADAITPRGGLQERCFTMLWPFASLDPDVVILKVVDAAEDHLIRCDEGSPGHALLSLDLHGMDETDGMTEETCSRSSGSA